MADHAVESSKGLSLSNKTYDAIRGFAQYWLPALGTLYAALAFIWHWGYAVEVGGTVAALITFLGVVMGLSKKSFDQGDADPAKYDGALVVDGTDPFAPTHSLEFNAPLEDLQAKSVLSLKVIGVPTDVATPDEGSRE